MRSLHCITVAALLLVAAPGHAQTAPAPAPGPAQPSPALSKRVAELPALLRGEVAYEDYFAPGFRNAIPKEKFVEVTAQLVAANGAVQSVESVTPRTPDTAELKLGFANGVADVAIAVDPAAPNQVTGLRVSGFAARAASMDAVAAQLKALPGTTGFAFAKLGSGAPQLINAQDADRPLAIGSAFKLVILAELVRSINAGERQWSDKVTLDGSPLPGGTYTMMPKGSQFTLREIAERMISISDNSATDILLGYLGRAKVEAMLLVVGVQAAARNRPYLSTLEMFKLKGVDKGALGDRWIAADEAGRRAMLTELDARPIADIDPQLFKDGKPLHIDTIEWFFSAADLVRTMDWLRRNTEGPSGAEARAILSKNPGIGPAAAGHWAWVGYKGGSETGVMNMTLLLQAKTGDWYALAGSWNDTAAGVDEARFIGLMTRATELALPH